jgi:tRNA (uracil-5-)-methyltransferase TRM9
MIVDQEEVFDRMAPGWYNRRHWSIFRPELEDLAKRWAGGNLLNIGCGHGADFLPFAKDFRLNGLDFSAGMLRNGLKYAKKFNFEAALVKGDAAALPFSDKSFDWAVAVATYHHLQSRQSRLQAMLELARVMKDGGEAFVTVWNRWQPAFWFRRKEMHVAWRTKEAVLQRYYYLFSRGEFESVAREAGFNIVRSYAESSYRHRMLRFSKNICLLLSKNV